MAGLQLQIGLNGVDRVSKPFTDARKSTDRLRGSVSEAAGRIRTLERTSSDLTAFRKMKADAVANSKALAEARARTSSLGREMAQADKVTKSTRAEFERAKKELARLEDQERKNAQGLQAMRGKLKEAGVDTKALNKAQRQLAQDLDDARAAADRQSKALDQARKRTEKLARAKDRVKGLGRAFASAARSAGSLTGKVAGLLGPLGALGGIASAAGAAKLVTDYAAANDELSKFSRQIGFTAEGLQELQYAADRQGVSQETFNSSISAFSKRLGELKSGTGALSSLLKKSNPALAQQLKTAESSEEAFMVMMEALERIEDPQKRAALAAAAFSRSGMGMTRVAEAGSEGLAALREDARKLGIVVSNDTAAASEGFVDSMTRFQASVDGLGNAVAERLMPAVQPLIDRLTDWIMANRELLATRLDGLITKVAAAAENLDIDRIVTGIEDFAGTVSSVVDFIGGWENALIGLVVMMNGPLIGGLLGAAGGMVAMAATGGKAMVGLAGKMRMATGQAGLLSGAMTRLRGAGSAAGGALARGVGLAATGIGKLAGAARLAVPIVAGGIRTITTALMANPIGLIIGGIALAAGLLIAYWDDVKPFFTALWDGVTSVFSSAWQGIKALLSWTPMGLIAGNWSTISGWFTGLWDGVKAVFSGAWQGIKAILGFTPLGLVAENWSGLSDFFGGMLEGITGMFGEAWDWILAKVKTLVEPLQWVADKVGGLFGGGGGESKAMPEPTMAPPPKLKTRSVAAGVALAAAAPMAAAAAPTAPAPVHNEVHIQVHAQPGMDEQALAREIRRQVEEALRQRDRAGGGGRNRLYDGTE